MGELNIEFLGDFSGVLSQNLEVEIVGLDK